MGALPTNKLVAYVHGANVVGRAQPWQRVNEKSLPLVGGCLFRLGFLKPFSRDSARAIGGN